MASHRQLFANAWPYTLSMASTFIVQAVDSTMVAPMGATTLAALTVAATASFMPTAFMIGLITSVQKRVSGADLETRRRVLSSNLFVALLMAAPFIALYFFGAEKIASFYTQGPAVELAASFMRIFCFSFLFTSMNQALNGYWIGVKKPKTRLSIAVATTVVNVIGNLILSPRFGLEGVAFASTFAIFVAFAMNLLFTAYLENFRWSTPKFSDLTEDLKMVFGVSIHQLSLTLFINLNLAVVGRIGTHALALANVIGTLSLPALYLGIGYGVAAGSFLIPELAAHRLEEVRRIARLSMYQVALASLAFSVLLLIFSSPIRHWFFGDSPLYRQAELPFLFLSLLYLADGVGCALQRFHFVSEGLAKSWMIMGGVQFLIFLPVMLYLVDRFQIGYTTYFALHIAQRILIAVLLYGAWQQRLVIRTANQAPQELRQITTR